METKESSKDDLIDAVKVRIPLKNLSKVEELADFLRSNRVSASSHEVITRFLGSIQDFNS